MIFHICEIWQRETFERIFSPPNSAFFCPWKRKKIKYHFDRILNIFTSKIITIFTLNTIEH